MFENTALAIKEGVSGIFLSGLAILSRTEGEMTTLKEFSENAMLLHGMDGHPDWKNRQTRSLAGVHPNDILQSKIFNWREEKPANKEHDILSIDIEIRTIENQKLVILSSRSVCRVKNDCDRKFKVFSFKLV